MYTDMYGATFTGKQMSLLQKVKGFYSEQVNLSYTQHGTDTCWGISRFHGTVWLEDSVADLGVGVLGFQEAPPHFLDS